ncbi:MAG: hypothetical protein J6X49_03895 [Victivallales bacterium]|nr:hypothetical protein [Victivallales bacterium]
MASLTVETTRYIDFYQVQDRYGNNYVQPHLLSVVDSNGILTESLVKAANLTDAQKAAMEANGIKFDKYGNAYYETENLSRYLHYGVDSNGALYAFNYAGEKMKVIRDGTLQDPATGLAADSNSASTFLSEIKATYNLDWNNVSVTGLSLSRVIMLVTLIRAELVEEQLIEQMDELAKRTALLNGSADAESYILENMSNAISNTTSFTYTDGTGVHTTTLKNYLTDVLEITVSSDAFPPLDTTAWSTDQKNQIISAIQTKQDELNTISQETSINIQSLINKRDQAYLLGTNAIALFYSGHISVARNM